MSFGTNLQYLRKSAGLTQEQFAEKMCVSRQTVSKWESDMSYPETEKVISICDMFGCSMDVLFRGDCTLLNDDVSKYYNSHMNWFTALISSATFLIISGLSIMIFMFSKGVNENRSVGLFLSFVAVSVAIYIVSGIKHGEFLKKYKDKNIVVNKESQERFNKIFPFLIASATVLIIIGIVWLVVFSADVKNQNKYAALFLFDIAIAVAVYIIAGMQKSKYDLDEVKNPNMSQEEIEAEKKKGKYCGIIMMIAVILFFVLSFCFDYWKFSWVVFPIGGIICGIVSTALEK